MSKHKHGPMSYRNIEPVPFTADDVELHQLRGRLGKHFAIGMGAAGLLSVIFRDPLVNLLKPFLMYFASSIPPVQERFDLLEAHCSGCGAGHVLTIVMAIMGGMLHAAIFVSCFTRLAGKKKDTQTLRSTYLKGVATWSGLAIGGLVISYLAYFANIQESRSSGGDIGLIFLDPVFIFFGLTGSIMISVSFSGTLIAVFCAIKFIQPCKDR